jgi:hypothetical protein
MWGTILYDLSLQYGWSCPDREIITWCNFVARTDARDLALLLAEAISYVRWYTEPGKIDFEGFVALMKGNHRFTRGIFSIARVGLSNYFDDPTPMTLRPVLQFFAFPTHLSLPHLPIEDELEREYLEDESRISNHHYPPFILDGLNVIMKEWGSGTQGRGNTKSARRRQRQKSAPNDQVAARHRKHGGVQIKQSRKAAREMTGGRRAGGRRR